MPAGSGGRRCARRQASRSSVNARIVRPSDLCSWNAATVPGRPEADSSASCIHQPSARLARTAAAIAQCRTTATAVYEPAPGPGRAKVALLLLVELAFVDDRDVVAEEGLRAGH